MEFETSTNGGSGGRKKSSKACDACSSRKVRCDNLQPQCSRCRNLSLPCEYTRTVKKRGPPKGSSSSTYQRLRRLEELLTSVTSGDANASDVMEVLKRRKTASGATAEQTTVSAPDSDTSTRSSHSESPPSSTEGPSVDATGNGVLGADYGNSGVSIFAQPLDTPDETSFIWDDTFLQPAAPVGDDVVQRTAEFNAEILSAYFNYVSPTMPCVHRQTFLTKLNEQPPELVFAMYACSVPHSSLNSSFSASSATDYGNVYYEKAKALLNPLDSPRVYLSTVQAMLHIVYYITGVGIPSIDVADRYLGMAVTLAKQLGFDNVRLMETLPWLEREARIRTMWCLWIMDKYFVALVHRNPYLHHEWMRQYPYPCPDTIWELGTSNTSSDYPEPAKPNSGSFASLVYAHKILSYISDISFSFKALPGYAEMDYEAMWNDVSRSALSPTSFVTPNFSNKESATYPFLMEMLTMLKTSSPPPGNPLYIHFHLITYTALCVGVGDNRNEMSTMVRAVISLVNQSTSSEGVTDIGTPIGSFSLFFVACQAVRFSLLPELTILLGALESYGLARWPVAGKLAKELRKTVQTLLGPIVLPEILSSNHGDKEEGGIQDLALIRITSKLQIIPFFCH